MLEQAIRAEIAGCRGQNRHLTAELGKLSAQAQQELLWLLRGLKDEVRQAERTCRPFPGGPRVRL